MPPKKSLKDIKGLSEMKVEKLKAAVRVLPLPSPSGPRSKSWHPVSRLTPPAPAPLALQP